MKTKNSEKGQALILIVFGIVALVAMTGLAIDGGNAYSDRRGAQNAADTAALAGALTNTRNPGTANVQAAALASTKANGYDANDPTKAVSVRVDDSPSSICPGNAGGKDITVQITSNVHTFFAPVLGIKTLTNVVTASSRSNG